MKKHKSLNIFLLRPKNNKGIALVISLVVTMFLLTFGSILLSRTFFQKNLVDREKKLANAFYIAEAGVQAGLNRLDRLVNTYLLNTISTTNPDTLSYKINQLVSQNKSIDFLIEFSKDNGISQFEESGDLALHQGVVVELNQGRYQYKIRIRQKGTPTPIAAEIWDFPFYFTVESNGSVGDTVQWVSASGSFNIRIQRVSFSKAILFKNADFKNQTDEKAYIASSGDITKKITWQGAQL